MVRRHSDRRRDSAHALPDVLARPAALERVTDKRSGDFAEIVWKNIAADAIRLCDTH
jgi:hypothetical protein